MPTTAEPRKVVIVSSTARDLRAHVINSLSQLREPDLYKRKKRRKK